MIWKLAVRYQATNGARAKAINAESKLPELRNYSLAYLHYLFKIKEPLGARLATLNNLEFYLDLMSKIRQDISNNRL